MCLYDDDCIFEMLDQIYRTIGTLLGRGVRGEQSRLRQAPQDHGPVRPDAEGVPRRRDRSGNVDRDDGWAGCDVLENHTAVAVGDRPAHEVLEWIHRVFSNLKRWGLGVLHGFRRKHLDWQLAEWSFRWNWRRRGESLFALLGPGANPPRTAALRLYSRFGTGSQVDPSKSLRKPPETAGLRSFRPNFRAESPLSTRINMLRLRTQSNKPYSEIVIEFFNGAYFFFVK